MLKMLHTAPTNNEGRVSVTETETQASVQQRVGEETPPLVKTLRQ